MKPGKHFNQQQKLAVLASAKTVGVKEAAVLAEVHYTTIYDWRRQLEALGEEAFLARTTPSRGRGEKRISESQEKAILATWERHPGFGPGQVRNQLRRQRSSGDSIFIFAEFVKPGMISPWLGLQER